MGYRQKRISELGNRSSLSGKRWERVLRAFFLKNSTASFEERGAGGEGEREKSHVEERSEKGSSILADDPQSAADSLFHDMFNSICSSERS